MFLSKCIHSVINLTPKHYNKHTSRSMFINLNYLSSMSWGLDKISSFFQITICKYKCTSIHNIKTSRNFQETFLCFLGWTSYWLQMARNKKEFDKYCQKGKQTWKSNCLVTVTNVLYFSLMTDNYFTDQGKAHVTKRLIFVF